VDDWFAKRYFADGGAVGRRIRLERFTVGGNRAGTWMDVVGVVGHIATRSLAYAGKPQIYTPLLAASLHFTALVASTSTADPMAVVPGMRQIVRDMDPDLPLFNTAPMTQLISDTAGSARLSAFVFAAFAAVAWLLAAVGLAGVVGFSVTVRTRELGIRLALGATPRALIGRVVADGAALTIAGVAIGVAVGLMGAKALSSLLVGVRPLDPVVVGATATALLATGVAASYVPARRVSRVDPLTALKVE
jgi:ABC-type antimicrobial peptide transport system permease subunit